MTVFSLLAAACQFPGFSGGGSRSRNERSGNSKGERSNGTLDDRRNARTDAGDEVDSGRSRDQRTETLTPKPPLVLPAGTRLAVTLSTGLDSGTTRVGDSVIGTISTPVVAGDAVVLPAGSELRGTVTTSVISGKTKGRGQLGFRFDKITVRGQEHDIALSGVAIQAKSGKGKDAKMIGGGAAAGALIGALAGGKNGALIGAGVGAGAGTGATLATRGEQARAPAGSRWTVKTTREFSIVL
jgi:hypothetical protein